MTDAELRAEIAIKVFGWKVTDRGRPAQSVSALRAINTERP